VDRTSALTTPAATTATAAPAQPAAEAGWVRNFAAIRPSSSRTDPNTAIPTGSAPRQPARREARTASMTAARCRRGSSTSDT
jgi:hypothetical protein